MVSLKIVFICHNNETVSKTREKHPSVAILFVGNSEIHFNYYNDPNIYLAREFANNIEDKPKLLTFTAWYLIVKNNLFTEYEYICLLEYDVILSEQFETNLQLCCQNENPDIVSFMTVYRYFFWDINQKLFNRFLEKKNCTYNIDQSWYPTTNHCMRRELLSDFVDWYYPDCLDFLRLDRKMVSWYHERWFSMYSNIFSKKVCLQDGLTHIQHGSHTSCNLVDEKPASEELIDLYYQNPQDTSILNKIDNYYRSPKKYFLVYNDGTHNTHINNLLQSVVKYSDFNIIIFNKTDIDAKFLEDNKNILELPRGGGYWLWKSYIINKTLEELHDNDLLFYMDSKYFFLRDFTDLYKDIMETRDILIWKNKPNEAVTYMRNWCKMDVIVNSGIYEPVFKDNIEVCWAGAMLLKKTSKTVNIMKEWLGMCCNYHNITDSPSILQNSPEYCEHRHDQSLLSIVLHKHHIPFEYFECKYLQNGRYPF
jgi:GR25 family glycosyltransferase involved in LPS biosynthesis